MSTPKHVFVGMPVYDSWKDKFALSLMQSFAGAPCPMTLFSLCGDSLIPRARNNLAAEFLDSPCSHLLFLDTDLEFNPSDLHKLLKHDLDIVGGVYYQKRYDRRLAVVNGIEGETLGKDGLIKVRHVGTGMMLIRREVFASIAPLVPSYHTCDDEKKQRRLHEFFPIGVHDDYYESEDWAFCRLARQVGIDVWADTSIVAAHHGAAVYPSPVVEAMRQRLDAALIAARGLKASDATEELLAILSGTIEEPGRR